MTREQSHIHDLIKLMELDEARAKINAEYEAQRARVDEWSDKQTTTVGRYTVKYDQTTTTKKDTKGLYAEFGITKEDEERYTTRTPSTRYAGVVKA